MRGYITVFAPLLRAEVKNKRVGIAGIGGLGHLAVKIAKKLKATVYALTTTPWKLSASAELGADHAILMTDAMKRQSFFGKLDFILDTISSPHDLDRLLELLKPGGRLHIVGNMRRVHQGSPEKKLIFQAKQLTTSNVGGLRLTQQCLDFCVGNNILPDVEVVRVNAINESMQKMANRQARFRFVIDMQSLI